MGLHWDGNCEAVSPKGHGDICYRPRKHRIPLHIGPSVFRCWRWWIREADLDYQWGKHVD
jgi:hypothetical protein